MRIENQNLPGDALTVVLDYLKIEGRVFCVCDIKSHEIIEGNSGRQMYLYFIESGEGKIKLKTFEKEIKFVAGDLLLINGSEDHLIYNGALINSDHVEGLFSEIKEKQIQRCQPRTGVIPVRFIGAAFTFKYPDNPHLTAALPPLIQIRIEERESDNLLGMLLDILSEETRQMSVGAGLIANRVTEMIFVRMIGVWIETRKKGAASWLSALDNNKINQALALLHQNPEKNWKAGRLAEAVGMEKSTFRKKFVEVVGTPPQRYLIKWKMNLALGYLQSGELNVGEVATRIGFTRDGFSRSFKKHFGIPPIDYKPK